MPHTKHPAHGHGKERESHGAIVVVAQGTTQAEGRAVISRAVDQIRAWCPGTVVKYAFTSEVVRNVLSEADERIPSPLAAVTSLMDEGHRRIVLQPLCVTPGLYYHGLYSIASALNSIAGPHYDLGLDGVLISRPLLLLEEDYRDAAAAILEVYGRPEPDSGLVLIAPESEGGGDPALCQLQMILDETAGGGIVIGAASGYPGIDQVAERLQHMQIKTVTLAPLTLVPGIHSWIEIAGENNEDSCLKRLQKAGYLVTTDTRAVGEYQQILDLFGKRLKETIQSHDFF